MNNLKNNLTNKPSNIKFDSKFDSGWITFVKSREFACVNSSLKIPYKIKKGEGIVLK